MDHRGHYWPDSGRHSHRKDGEGFSRSSQQERAQGYPPPDLRDGHWGHFPPPRAEQYPYRSQQYQYGYGPEHQRPLSRHGYDCPPHSHWDYSYGYYDYYRGPHGRPDAGWWGPPDSWRADRYHEQHPEHPGSLYAEEHRLGQVRDGSQHLHHEDFPSRENDEISSYYLGTLESSKTSGLSSSSYELSQYINGADHGDPAPQPDGDCARVRQMPAPLKFSIPHALVSFGPAGQLIRVATGVSTQEKVSHLEIHSLEVILSETQEQQEMRSFPGPFTREGLHKVDAIEFAQQMAGACMRDTKLQDRSCAALLWNILILLCRQNGQIVGSDIAELLMQDSHSDGSCPSDAPTLIDFNEDASAAPCEGDDLLTGNGSSFSSESSEKGLQTYTQLLLAGRKKEALESAMSSGLWGHALFLASKMDNRSYTTVLSRFTGQLRPRDPLQTLFQLLSGRIPAVATCCGNEKWGDWRPHLAVLLSNETGDPAIQQKAIVTMGDTLASRGLVHAAHVCYLTASVPFGAFTQKAERLVLLGSSHRKSFECFATNAAIRCTEVYEYSQTLGGKNVSVPSFQAYKLLYAGRLLDCGLPSQAFHYCEVVGQAVLRQQQPFFVLTAEVIKLSDRLRYSEGQFSEAGLHGAGQEPDWLKHLRARHHSFQTGTLGCTETQQPQNSVAAPQVPSELDLDDLSIIQSPEPELLYYRGPEDPEGSEHQGGGDPGEAMAWGSGGAQDRAPLTPALVAYTPPVPTVALSHNFSYHNTDSAEVTSVSHCPPNNLAGAAEGAEGGAAMADGAKLEGSSAQQVIPEGPAEETAEPPKQQNTKKGWFSGWFKSRPKEVPKDTSERGGPAQTELPASAGLRPPPPPAALPPGMFPPPASSAGVNPFSRKAGQQLG